jgi:hypothetical protein
MAKSKAAAPLLGHGDLGTSLLFVFPLFLLYGVGVMFAPSMNGVDFVSRNLFAAVGHDRKLYLLVHVGMAVGFLAVLAVLRSKKLFDARRFPPMLLEAGIYALTLGTLILFVMHRILGIEPKLSMGLGTSIVLSIGAGVYEELVFRLGCFSGGAALARLFGLSNRLGAVLGGAPRRCGRGAVGVRRVRLSFVGGAGVRGDLLVPVARARGLHPRPLRHLRDGAQVAPGNVMSIASA